MLGLNCRAYLSPEQVLDANLEFNVSWAELNNPPRMGVSETDSIAFEWSKVRFRDFSPVVFGSVL